VYIIEANPRASRTVPFVAKAVGHPLAKYASLLMSGKTLPELGFTEEPVLNHVAVKEAVLPFEKFPGNCIPVCQGAEGLMICWQLYCPYLLNIFKASFFCVDLRGREGLLGIGHIGMVHVEAFFGATLCESRQGQQQR
jgi:hypothetical protein